MLWQVNVMEVYCIAFGISAITQPSLLAACANEWRIFVCRAAAAAASSMHRDVHGVVPFSRPVVQFKYGAYLGAPLE